MSEVELAAHLHELVREVGVEQMSPAGVRRRVEQRAHRRRVRRRVGSVALACVAVSLLLGARTVESPGRAGVVATTGPIAPVTSGPVPGTGPSPTLVAQPPPPDLPLPSTTSPTVGADGRDAAHQGPQRAGPADSPPRGD